MPCRSHRALETDDGPVGNGTQDTFYEDPNVLYMSIHVYAEGRFYPCRDSADHNHCGEGRGLGKYVSFRFLACLLC